MRLGSSPFPGLLTRLDTGHMRSVSSGADLSNSVPASPDSHAAAAAFLFQQHGHSVVDRADE